MEPTDPVVPVVGIVNCWISYWVPATVDAFKVVKQLEFVVNTPIGPTVPVGPVALMFESRTPKYAVPVLHIPKGPVFCATLDLALIVEERIASDEL